MKIKILAPLVFGIMSLLTLSSCEDEMAKVTNEESIKDIAGNWKVVQLIRNGEDLSKRMEVKDFQINFNTDGTYTLAEQLPFVVDASGRYMFNDPQFPFSLILRPEGEEKEVAVKFQFPVVAGKRQLSLSFSLGCSSNSYQFNFERQN